MAGFVGSHLAEALLAAGWRVRGVDNFSDYYARELKQANLSGLLGRADFDFDEIDLRTVPPDALLAGVEVIFHQAGQPGVRGSWGPSFQLYLDNNVLATQRLLEASLQQPELRRFVFASSSSVYGDSPELPSRETTLPRPISPYGVSKLAAEHLCRLYARLGVPTVALRYFTVYGPRQRPDMAFSRFIAALLAGQEIAVFGDGEQTRDFTFVADIVAANLAAATCPLETVGGRVFNLGGGSRVSVNRVLEILSQLVGREANVRYDSEQPGDARHTQADCTAARQTLGFAPRVELEAGLREQVESTLAQGSP